MASREELQKYLGPIRKAWKAKILTKISLAQAKDREDKPAKGPIWVSRCQLNSPPEDDLRRLVFRVIEHLAIDGTTIQHDSPPTAAFAGEWLGPRKGVDRNAPEPDLSEAEKFHKLGQDVGDQSSVLLFIHGGNLTFGGPVPYRPLLQRLTAYEAIRCFTPAYRLAPKDAFPSALIDVLSAYLYLLSAPPGSFHQPIPASRIIFAGESAGCSLMFALVKVLLTAKKLGVSHVQFHGASIPLDLPAGITAFAPYCDFTTCLPSERLNMDNDVFVPTMLNPANDPVEADEAVNWPSNPPRHDFTCYQSALDHPLVSPIAVEDWSGAPPMWMCAGGHERPLDSGKVVAKRAHQSGVPVRFEVFDELPHIWFRLLAPDPSLEAVLHQLGQSHA